VRLFVAVSMPASVTAAIDTTIAPARVRFPEARWVPQRDRHVTLTFLGSTPRTLEGWVREQVGAVAASWHPFDIQLGGLGGFPAEERARILWLGVDDRDDRLEALSVALDTALAPEFTPERRSFIPHVTVARSDRDLVLTGLWEPDRPSGAAISVREIVLYRSHAGTLGTRYEALASFTLGD
jgi:RNA 2',3'-cyclic 3'-phosphodiesterase